MSLGLLMESAQAHQKLAETHLDRLRAHTQDLDGVVRDEIRRTLIEELQELTAESHRAAQSLRAMKRAADLRAVVLSLGVACVSAAVPSTIAYWVLPTRSEIDALRVRRDELAANLARLEREGGRIEWRRCGTPERLCVHVDKSAPAYGEKADYYVVKGY